MKPPLGKQRTREHVIADMSVCFVEWQALQCGYTVERVFHDYGIDLEIDTFNDQGEIQPGTLKIQVKATDGLKLRPARTWVPLRIERSDLRRWLAELEPVILILFDAKRTRAFWVCVQEYFAAMGSARLFAIGKSITVRIPVANRLNPKAIRTFARLKEQFRAQARLPHE